MNAGLFQSISPSSSRKPTPDVTLEAEALPGQRPGPASDDHVTSESDLEEKSDHDEELQSSETDVFFSVENSSIPTSEHYSSSTTSIGEEDLTAMANVGPQSPPTAVAPMGIPSKEMHVDYKLSDVGIEPPLNVKAEPPSEGLPGVNTQAVSDNKSPLNIDMAVSPATDKPLPVETKPTDGDREASPATDQPLPVETKPPDIDSEASPAMDKPLPVETKPPDGDREASPARDRPLPVETKPPDGDREASPARVKPLPVGPKPPDSEGDREASPARDGPLPVETKPPDGDREASPAKDRPLPVETKPPDGDREASPATDKPLPVETKPPDSDGDREASPARNRPLPVESKPPDGDREASPATDKPLPVETKPPDVDLESPLRDEHLQLESLPEPHAVETKPLGATVEPSLTRPRLLSDGVEVPSVVAAEVLTVEDQLSSSDDILTDTPDTDEVTSNLAEHETTSEDHSRMSPTEELRDSSFEWHEVASVSDVSEAISLPHVEEGSGT